VVKRLKCSNSVRVRGAICGHALSWRSTMSTLDVSVPRLLFLMAQHSENNPSALWQTFVSKFFSLFGECVCIHCFDCSLVSTFIMLLIRCDWEIHRHLCGIALKKSFCAQPWAFSEPTLRKTCDSLA
jgi:hypothetical protein